MKKLWLILWLIFAFSIKSKSQLLPPFMKDFAYPINMMVTAKNPDHRIIFSGSSVYYTDSANSIISSKSFHVIGGSGSWASYAENENVYAAILNYSYVTPWANDIGNLICLFNRNTGDTIRTFLQKNLRSHYLKFHNDTLLVYNRNIYSIDSTFILKKISADGTTILSKEIPYTIHTKSDYKIFNQGSYIYIYSLNPNLTGSATLTIKRFDLSGELKQSNSIDLEFSMANASINISNIISNANNMIVLLKRISEIYPHPEDYYLVSLDTNGQKNWEKPIIGAYSYRNRINLMKNSDSTFFSYGFIPNDSLWSYFIDESSFSTGRIINRSENKLLRKEKELTSNSYLPKIIKKQNGWGMLISYQNKIKKESQYPISLISHFTFDNQLNELDRNTIRLNGYYLKEIIDIKYDSQDNAIFYGNHQAHSTSAIKSYSAKYPFDTDYEYTYYTVGIEPGVQKANSSIYPNPTSNFAIIKSNEIKHGEEFTLYNINGIAVQSFVADTENSLKIRKNHLPSGIYFLRETSHKTGVIHKIIFID